MPALYARVNEPIIVEDEETSEDELISRAEEALTIDGLDSNQLDFGVEPVRESEDTVAVYLYTLFRVEVEDRLTNKEINKQFQERITLQRNGAIKANVSIEWGEADHWEHLMGSWTFEGGNSQVVADSI